MIKGRVKDVYLRGHTYWLAKQVNGRRSFVSLETDDYIAALQRAREIMDSPELQPARSLTAEIDRFLKHKFETNRYSKMSADSKRLCLIMFAGMVKDIPPANLTSSHCKAYYNAAKARVTITIGLCCGKVLSNRSKSLRRNVAEYGNGSPLG